jgi:DNA repair exonuclease SbcCD ATPase subunit
MDKLSQVRGVLRAIKSIALQGVYAETFKGMEAQCISTYRRCVATLKTVEGYEEVDSIAPELADDANMQQIGFAVETILSLISEGERPEPGFLRRPGSFGTALMPGMRFRRMRRVLRRDICRGAHGMRHHSDVQEQMQEEMEHEQERFEGEVEKIEEQIEELQEKIEETREQLEERFEEIRERYEEKVEELQEQEEHEEEHEDEPKTE